MTAACCPNTAADGQCEERALVGYEHEESGVGTDLTEEHRVAHTLSYGGGDGPPNGRQEVGVDLPTQTPAPKARDGDRNVVSVAKAPHLVEQGRLVGEPGTDSLDMEGSAGDWYA